MTDYNDGKWHHYNGDYPEGVHPRSRVTYVWHDERTGKCGITEDRPAHLVIAWSQTLKFRVTKPFHEPRVIWVNEYPDGDDCSYSTEDGARRASAPHAIRVAVRYVEAPE